MTSCYWLQGFFELNSAAGSEEGLTCEQALLIEQHLAMVFKHEIDPSFGKDLPELQKIHDPDCPLGNSCPHSRMYTC